MPKQRYFGEYELPPNLYPDNSSVPNPNKWRYRLADGSFVRWRLSVREAISKAIQANEFNAARRKKLSANDSRAKIPHWVERYITYVKLKWPKKAATERWKFNVYYLRAMAREFNETKISQASSRKLASWWDSLTYDQQAYQRSELRRFFHWCITKGATAHNPFSNEDNVASLILRERPHKQRLPILLNEYWRLRTVAIDMGYHHVAVAMHLSLATTMRQSDILELRFDQHIHDDCIRKVINKTSRARPSSWEARMEFTIDGNEILEEALFDAKKLAFSCWDCPYLVCRRPLRLRQHGRFRKGSFHPARVFQSKFQQDFRKVRDASEIWKTVPTGRKPPGFHEIRGLAITELSHDHPISLVQRLANHTNESITKGYMAENNKPWINVQIAQNAKRLKNDYCYSFDD